MSEVDYLKLSQEKNIIMYNGECSVFRANQESSLETVHFIFNTIKNENNLHEVVLVDNEYKKISGKIMLFADVNEFFGFSNYLLRNGIGVSA